MKYFIAVLFAALVIGNGLVIAQPQNKYQIIGAGAISCGTFLSFEAEKSNLTLDWTQGFLSGMNAQRYTTEKKAIYLPGAASIKAYMRKYCNDNPLTMYLDGAKQLFEEASR